MKFLISSEKIVLGVLGIIIMYWAGFFILATAFLLLFVSALLMTRLRPPEYKGEDVSKVGILYSPVNGFVSSIDESDQCRRITLVIPWWKSCGIYMPLRSEVETIEHHIGKSGYRYTVNNDKDYSTAAINLKSDNISYKMSFIKCILGFWPTFYVLSGDKAQSLAQIGYFFLGGSVRIEIPLELKTCVQVKERVSAGETVIASVI